MLSRANTNRILYPLIIIIALIVGLQFGLTAFGVSKIFLPTPAEVWGSLSTYSSLFLTEGLFTLEEILTGFMVGAGVGIGLAIMMFYSTRVRNSILPLLIIFQVIPRIALAPLFIIWLGFGFTYKVVFTIFIAFFPVIVSSIGGFMSVEPEEMELFQSLNAGSRITFRRLLFPTALPELFSGLKVSMTLAMVGAVIAEFLAGSTGLGYLIVTADQTLNTPMMFGGIVVLAIMGLGLYGALEMLQRLMIPWFYLERNKR